MTTTDDWDFGQLLCLGHDKARELHSGHCICLLELANQGHTGNVQPPKGVFGRGAGDLEEDEEDLRTGDFEHLQSRVSFGAG